MNMIFVLVMAAVLYSLASVIMCLVIVAKSDDIKTTLEYAAIAVLSMIWPVTVTYIGILALMSLFAYKPNRPTLGDRLHCMIFGHIWCSDGLPTGNGVGRQFCDICKKERFYDYINDCEATDEAETNKTSVQ